MNELDSLSIEIFKKWNEALQTKNSKIVRDMYSKDASLMGTVSSKLRTQFNDEIKEYFDHFLKINPSGKIQKLKDKAQMIALDTILYTGLYTFETDNGEVKARFTYIFKKEDQEWKILHHHSSQIPNNPMD